MKLKSKIIAGVFSAVALAAIPVSIALTVSSCGSGNIDGDSTTPEDNPNQPIDPTPTPQPEPSPGPTPTPTPTPENVEVSAETLKTINDALVSVVSNMTSEDQVDATKESIKSQLEAIPFFTTNKITVASVEMTPVKGSVDVKYNVSITLSSGKKLTLADNEYFNVNGNTISTKNPLATKITVTPTPEPQPEPEKDISFSNDDVTAIATIFTDNLAALNNKDNLEATKQTILSKLNEVTVIKTNNISVDNLQLNEVTVGDQIKYNVSFALSVTPTKPITVPDNETFTIADNQWTSTQPFATAIAVTPPTPPVNNKIEVTDEVLGQVLSLIQNGIKGMKSAANESLVQTKLTTEIGNVQLFKDNKVTVSSIVMNKTTESNVDYYAPAVTLSAPADKQLVFPNTSASFEIASNTITVKNKIAAQYLNAVAVSTETITQINKVITDIITNLVAPETTESLQNRIQSEVNKITDLSSNGISASSVSVTSSVADDFYQQYSVSVTLDCANPLDIATDGGLTVNGNILSTPNPIHSQILTQVSLTAQNMSEIYDIVREQMKILTSASQLIDAKEVIKSLINELNFMSSNNVIVTDVNLTQDTTSSAFVKYFVDLTFNGNTATVVIPENDFFTVTDQTVKTKLALETQIKPEVSLDSSILVDLKNAIDNVISKVTESDNEQQIKDNVIAEVNNISNLKANGITATNVVLTKSTVDKKVAYSVSLDLHSEKNIILPNSSNGMTVKGMNVSTDAPIKTTISAEVDLTVENMTAIYNILNTKISSLTSSSEVPNAKQSIKTEIEALNFMSSNNITISEVVLTPDNSSADYVKYFAEFTFNLKDKTLVIPTNDQFDVTDQTVRTKTSIQTKFKQDITLSASILTELRTAITNVISSVTKEESEEQIKQKVSTAVNGISELSTNSITANNVTLTKSTVEGFVAYSVSLDLHSEKNIVLPSSSDGITVSGTTISTTTPIKTTISTDVTLTASDMTSVYNIVSDEISKITDEASVMTAQDSIKSRISGLDFMAPNNITVQSVTLEKDASTSDVFVKYFATVQFDTANQLNFASDSKFTVTNKSIKTTASIQSGIKQTLTLQDSVMGELNTAITSAISTVTDGMTEQQIQNAISEKVLAISEIHDNSVSVASVSIVPSTIDGYVAYTVTVNLSSEKNLVLPNSTAELTTNGTSVTTASAIKSSVPVPASLTEADLQSILATITSTISSINQILPDDQVVTQLNEALKTNDVISSKYLTVSELTSNRDETGTYIQYKPSFTLTGLGSLSIPTSSSFDVSNTTLTVKAPIATKVPNISEDASSTINTDIMTNMREVWKANEPSSEQKAKDNIKSQIQTLVPSVKVTNITFTCESEQWEEGVPDCLSQYSCTIDLDPTIPVNLPKNNFLTLNGNSIKTYPILIGQFRPDINWAYQFWSVCNDLYGGPSVESYITNTENPDINVIRNDINQNFQYAFAPGEYRLGNNISGSFETSSTGVKKYILKVEILPAASWIPSIPDFSQNQYSFDSKTNTLTVTKNAYVPPVQIDSTVAMNISNTMTENMRNVWKPSDPSTKETAINNIKTQLHTSLPDLLISSIDFVDQSGPYGGQGVPFLAKVKCVVKLDPTVKVNFDGGQYLTYDQATNTITSGYSSSQGILVGQFREGIDWHGVFDPIAASAKACITGSGGNKPTVSDDLNWALMGAFGNPPYSGEFVYSKPTFNPVTNSSGTQYTFTVQVSPKSPWIPHIPTTSGDGWNFDSATNTLTVGPISK